MKKNRWELWLRLTACALAGVCIALAFNDLEQIVLVATAMNLIAFGTQT